MYKSHFNTLLESSAPMNENERQKILARYEKEEAPLVHELNSIGIDIPSAWDMYKIKRKYPQAIPILLKHLNKDYSHSTRRGIIDAICRKWSRDLAWEPILRAYKQEPNLEYRARPGEIGAPNEPKQAMANGLVCMARPSDMDEMIALIENQKNGPSRVLLISYFMRSRKQRAFETLARLSSDPDLKVEIAIRLKEKLRRQAKKGAREAKH